MEVLVLVFVGCAVYVLVDFFILIGAALRGRDITARLITWVIALIVAVALGLLLIGHVGN